MWHLPPDSDGLPAELRAALADPHGPGIVAPDRRPPQPLVRGGDAPRRRRRPLPAAVVPVAGHGRRQGPRLAARRAAALSAHSLPSASRAGRDAHVFTVFSTKGGSGKTVIATNLAVCFARQGLRTLLVDLDLHSGDDALVLGLSPRWTVLDLVAVARRPRRREARRVRHPALERRRPAPRADPPGRGGAGRDRPAGAAARGGPRELRRGRHRHVVELLAGDAAGDRPHRHAHPRRRVRRPDDQEPEDRARDARPARDEPGSTCASS